MRVIPNKRTFTEQDILNSACGAKNEHLRDKPQEKKKKPNKYRNKPKEYNGVVFQSTKECTRYKELIMMQKAGLIGQLELQKKFLLIEANEIERKCEYLADFVYYTIEGEYVVEDTKSDATRKLSTYIIKRKLMLKLFNIKIQEI